MNVYRTIHIEDTSGSVVKLQDSRADLGDVGLTISRVEMEQGKEKVVGTLCFSKEEAIEIGNAISELFVENQP